jgi:hypothetical protein
MTPPPSESDKDLVEIVFSGGNEGSNGLPYCFPANTSHITFELRSRPAGCELRVSIYEVQPEGQQSAVLSPYPYDDYVRVRPMLAVLPPINNCRYYMLYITRHCVDQPTRVLTFAEFRICNNCAHP